MAVTSELYAKDYYKALGTSWNASPEEIKKAYHEAVRYWHPDRQKADTAAEVCSSITSYFSHFGRLFIS